MTRALLGLLTTLLLAPPIAAQPPFPQVYVESVFAEVSTSSTRDLGVGAGGVLGLGEISLGALGVAAGARKFFLDAENVSAYGIQVVPEIVLHPELLNLGSFTIRPLVGAGYDLEVQRFDDVSTTVTVSDGGTVILGGLQARPRQPTGKVPVLGDIALVRTLFHENDVTEVRARLLIFITPRLVRDSSE